MPPSNNVEQQDPPAPDYVQAPVQVQPGTTTNSLGALPPVQGEPSGGLKARLLGTSKKKLVLIAVAGAVLMGGGASAYYLGIVVPNKPENLWQTALERTAKGYDELVAHSKANSDLKGAQVKGDYKLEGPFATDGTFEVQSYENTTAFKADMGIVGLRVNIEGRVLPAVNSSNPDVYIKATGLKGLAALQPELGTIAEQYENKWLSIDHTLFDNFGSMAVKEDGRQSGAEALTPDDFRKIAETVGRVNKEYVFTTDINKAILTVAKQVGRETKDNRSVYHYEVGLHKQHTKDYLNALVDSLQDTPVTKLTEGRNLRDVINMNELLRSVDEYKESEVAHVYVDLKTRLIRTVRLENSSDKSNYMELTQDYTGGDVVPLKIHLRDNTDGEASSLSASFSVNKKTNAADGNLVIEGPLEDGGTEMMKLSIKYALTMRSEKVDAPKPEDAVSLYELLGPLMRQYMSVGTEEASHNLDEV